MADDHDALLAKAPVLAEFLISIKQYRMAEVVIDLAAELRALTSRYEAALDIIRRLRDPLNGWTPWPDHNGGVWAGRHGDEPMTPAEKAVLKEATRT